VRGRVEAESTDVVGPGDPLRFFGPPHPRAEPGRTVDQLPFTHGFSLSDLDRLSVTSWKERVMTTAEKHGFPRRGNSPALRAATAVNSEVSTMCCPV
jgi:hypothetical protein